MVFKFIQLQIMLVETTLLTQVEYNVSLALSDLESRDVMVLFEADLFNARTV